MLRLSLTRPLTAGWRLTRVSARGVVKDSRYYLELARERGVRLPGGFLYGEKPLLPGERRVRNLGDRAVFWGGWFALFLLYFLTLTRPPSSWEMEVERTAIARYEGLLTEAGIEDLTVEEEY